MILAAGPKKKRGGAKAKVAGPSEVVQKVPTSVEPAPPETETICGFPVHPAAYLLPDPSDEEFDRMVADVGEYGIRIPIVLSRWGGELYILDGRSRARAWEKLGRKPKDLPRRIVKVDDAVAFVLSMNAVHRMLAPDQIVAIYLLAERAKVEQAKQAAAESQKAGLKVGAKSRERHVALTGKTAAAISRALGGKASTRRVERVQRVARIAPERLLDVAHRKVTAAEVFREVREQRIRQTPQMGAPHFVMNTVLDAAAKKPVCLGWTPKAAHARVMAYAMSELYNHGCDDRPALAKIFYKVGSEIEQVREGDPQPQARDLAELTTWGAARVGDVVMDGGERLRVTKVSGDEVTVDYESPAERTAGAIPIPAFGEVA